MAKINIPTLGTLMRLEKPWTFHLHREHRNGDLFDVVGTDVLSEELITEAARFARVTDKRVKDGRWGREHRLFEITLPIGTVLSLDRIYIRKGLEDFDSLTFHLLESPAEALLHPKKLGGSRQGRCRFWAKLEECNGIEYSEITDEQLSRPAKKGVPPFKVYVTKQAFASLLTGHSETLWGESVVRVARGKPKPPIYVINNETYEEMPVKTLKIDDNSVLVKKA